MQIITEKGKLFGILNIFDLAVLLFVALLVTTTYVYTHTPPRVREHQEVVFQMYFIGVPYSVGQELFVPGNEFIATYTKNDRAIISAVELQDAFSNNPSLTAFQEIPPYDGYKMDYLVTINGSLEIDVEGDFLFNDQNVAPGNILYLQLNNSFLRGFVWRMHY